MPINVYTGLMGSGKSFECVSSVIVPAVNKGRTVVTNVDGIDGDAVRAYCHEKFGTPMDKLGEVRHCVNDDVGKVSFLPHGTAVDTFVRPGDLVCIDEAWRFWGGDCRLLQEHKVFFREHRHYVDPATKVACDLVLMVQDIGDLHRTLRVVVELTFRTTKIKSLGLSKVYRVEMWEGYKLTAKGRASVSNKKYDAEVFPLYSSYDGGAGKEVQVDSRQNVLRNPMLWLLVLFVLAMFAGGVYGIWWFFSSSRRDKPVDAHAVAYSGSQGANGVPAVANPLPAAKNAPAPFSEVWRVVGLLEASGQRFVVVADPAGRLRYESPSMFSLGGGQLIGNIDGGRVTFYSGAPAGSGAGASAQRGAK